jgi:hypothetical protein
VKARHAASIALAALLVLGTSGCTLSAVQGTLAHYQPSDGTAGDIGDLKLRNVIGLTDNGDDISLLMTIINGSSEDVDVTFQYEDADGEWLTIPLKLEANSSVSVGAGDGAEVVLRNVGAIVGSLVTVLVQYGNEQTVQLQVPTLDGTIEAYSDLLPGPAPTPTPTLTATPEPTETPAP